MRHLKTTLAVLGAVTILVLAGNTIALATTGHSFILGKSNTANKLTTLTRTTAGSALKLGTRSTSNAPLQVNGRGKVANLNADLVDGLDSTVLRNHSYVFTKNVTSSVSNFSVTVPVPAGTYQFSYSAFLQGATNVWNYCQIRHIHGAATSYVAIVQFNAGAQTPGLSAAGVVTKATGDTVDFECGSNGTFFTTSDIPIQLVMTPTAIVTSSSLRIAPASARVAGH